MPRAIVTRESLFLRQPSDDGLQWFQRVYALPGTVFTIADDARRSGSYVEVTATGAGNFQANAVDTQDVIQRAQTVPRTQLQRQGNMIVLPGSTMIAASRKNVDVMAGTSGWIEIAALRIEKPRVPPRPSAWWSAPIAAVTIGAASAFTKLATR